jgi:hypothetical protein
LGWRCVRLAVAHRYVDRRRLALQRAADDRVGQQVPGIGRHQRKTTRGCDQGRGHRHVVDPVIDCDVEPRAAKIVVGDRSQHGGLVRMILGRRSWALATVSESGRRVQAGFPVQFFARPWPFCGPKLRGGPTPRSHCSALGTDCRPSAVPRTRVAGPPNGPQQDRKAFSPCVSPTQEAPLWGAQPVTSGPPS